MATLSSKEPQHFEDILDLIHEINEKRFKEYFEVDQYNEDSIGLFRGGSETPVIEIKCMSVKKISVDSPSEDWQRWVYHVLINDIAVDWDCTIAGKNKHEKEEGKFETFLQFCKETFKDDFKTEEHLNWVESQMPNDFAEIAYPNGESLNELLVEEEEEVEV